MSDEEPIFISDDNEEEVEELSGSGLEEVAQQYQESLTGTTVMGWPIVKAVEEPLAMEKQPMAEPNIMSHWTNQEWRKAESTQSLGYNGQSVQTKRHQAKVKRDKETEDVKLKNG